MQQTQQSARRRRRRAKLRTAAVVLVVLNVSVGMALSIVALRMQAERTAQVELALVELDRDVVVAAERLLGAEAATSEQDVDGALQAVRTGAQRLRDALAAADGIDVTDVASLAERLAIAEPSEAGFGRLRASIDNAVVTARDASATSRRTADALTVAMMVIAAAISMLLYRRGIAAAESAVRRSAQERLRGERRFRSLVQHSSDLILITDDEVVTYASPAVAELLGAAPEDVVGTRLGDHIHHDDRLRVVEMLTEARDAAVTVQARWRHQGGGWRHVESVHTDLRDEPTVRGVVVNAHDITAAKELEEQLRHLALHDPLTGLPNRELFLDRVEGALRRRERTGDPLAVLLVDLDGFKDVNDRYGHEAGNRLLEEVAGRLVDSVRPRDTVARLHGDEFALLLEDLTDWPTAERVALRVVEQLREPVELDGDAVVTAASVGLAAAGDALADADQLLRAADVAMYVAKREGKDRLISYEPSMQHAALERLRLRSELLRAVERDELVVYYQPILQLDAEQVTGVEALVRWEHPRRGLVPPNEFIPLAEETGEIVAIGRHVLLRACQQVAEWQRTLPLDEPLTVNVNISARQLQEAALVQHVEEALEISGLPPSCLVLEVTETMLLAHLGQTRTTLERLRGRGIRVAIDDFGTGYSQLQYLADLPVDILKVDRSFVAQLAERADTFVLVRTIAQLGADLGLDLVAEGIEQSAQLAGLLDLGYARGQGFMFAAPLPPAAFAEQLQHARDAGRWVSLAQPASSGVGT